MEFNRNHYFVLGLVVLGLGIQLRVFESYVLNEQATKVVAKFIKPSSPPPGNVPLFIPLGAPQSQRMVRPPKWIGWALLSVGGVLVLHSLAMQKPGGG